MLKGYLFAIALLATTVFAGNKNQSDGSLPYYVDYSCFKLLNQADQTYVQLHFFMNRNSLTFIPKDNDSTLKAGYVVSVLFTDIKNNSNRIDRNWNTVIDDKITAQDTAKEVPLIFEYYMTLKPGNYTMQVQIRDAQDTSKTGTYSDIIGVPDYDDKELTMSHIELASQIIKGGNPEEMFVKNGLTIFPNPSKFFGSNLPRLFIYAELYNLENKPNEPNNTYTVEYIITDEAGSVVKEFPSKTYNKVDRSAVILHSLNIISLATGRYFLMVRATDNTTKKIAQSKEFFVVFREGESLAELSGEASFFSDLDEQGAQKAEHIISCIANKDEIKAFKQLDLEGKKNFLDRFWKERDPSPGTRTNETLMDYYKRYEEANQRFGSPNRPGWKSDMGRIYITYGVPAQIEKHEFESNTLPYQVWYYLQLKDQPTQTVFVFADRDGTGQNYLIHSNARGEYNNPSWQQDIRKDF